MDPNTIVSVSKWILKIIQLVFGIIIMCFVSYGGPATTLYVLTPTNGYVNDSFNTCVATFTSALFITATLLMAYALKETKLQMTALEAILNLTCSVLYLTSGIITLVSWWGSKSTPYNTYANTIGSLALINAALYLSDGLLSAIYRYRDRTEIEVVQKTPKRRPLRPSINAEVSMEVKVPEPKVLGVLRKWVGHVEGSSETDLTEFGPKRSGKKRVVEVLEEIGASTSSEGESNVVDPAGRQSTSSKGSMDVEQTQC